MTSPASTSSSRSPMITTRRTSSEMPVLCQPSRTPQTPSPLRTWTQRHRKQIRNLRPLEARQHHRRLHIPLNSDLFLGNSTSTVFRTDIDPKPPSSSSSTSTSGRRRVGPSPHKSITNHKLLEINKVEEEKRVLVMNLETKEGGFELEGIYINIDNLALLRGKGSGYLLACHGSESPCRSLTTIWNVESFFEHASDYCGRV